MSKDNSVNMEEIHLVNIEDELKQCYLDYAMSVIVGRALPDVRDGLKPVHRRTLYAMQQLGNEWNKPYKKSARVVGDVIGKYHPHGESAVYDTIVRMAQPFSLRYLLVDGQGNFGSVDGDSAAAMRYTEVRMTKLAKLLLDDLEKDTVSFVPNYDESETIPSVLPARLPNLLVNGSSGIAVGMATNIPPHNLGEVLNACIAFIDDENISFDALMALVPGPDFPTAGIINGRGGIVEAYRTGRGRILVRARATVEDWEDSNRQSIIVTELPYQVNKARLIEKIADLVREEKMAGITGLRDESDKDGMRIVIEIKRNENAEVILNNLYSQTQMQVVFGINMVALEDGQPKLMNLKSLINAFIRHRREVVTRRTLFDLGKAKDRAHILEGLAVALTNIDAVIALIKAAPGPKEAKEGLLATQWKGGEVIAYLGKVGLDKTRPDNIPAEFGAHGDSYRLTDVQAQAILDLRLHRLTGLEQNKITEEYHELIKTIEYLLHILESDSRLMEVIREELVEVKRDFSDERRTEIIANQQDLETADLITPEDVVVTLSREGYVKYQPLTSYAAQRRGGRGKAAADVKSEDIIERLIVCNTHDTLLCFSSLGRVYWLKVYQLPQASRLSRGKPIVNLLPLDADERINTILPIKEFDHSHHIVMATTQGVIKKSSLAEFSRPRPSGLIACDLLDGDHLVAAAVTDGTNDIMLFTSEGKSIRFNEDDVREMGRTARGVRGVRMPEGVNVISMIVPKPEGAVLTATENGYGKRTMIDDFPVQGRGGQGVIAIQTTGRNGKLVSAVLVTEQDEVMLISDKGTLVRTRVTEISVIGRNTQGVRLMNLSEGESMAAVQRIEDVGSDVVVVEDTASSEE
jgi:DNA gyrase subunit A